MLSFPAPAVASLDDFDRLLGHLALVGAAERQDQAELEQELQPIRDRFKARQLVEVGADTLTYEDYRAKAKAALVAYATEKRTELLEGVDGQTRQFTNGTVSYRALAPALEDVDGQPKTTAEKLLAKVRGCGKEGLVAAIAKWIAGFKLDKPGMVTAADVFRVKVEVDRVALLKLVKAKKFTPKWLAGVNLKLATDRVAIDIEPAAALVKSERTAGAEAPAKLAA